MSEWVRSEKKMVDKSTKFQIQAFCCCSVWLSFGLFNANLHSGMELMTMTIMIMWTKHYALSRQIQWHSVGVCSMSLPIRIYFTCYTFAFIRFKTIANRTPFGAHPKFSEYFVNDFVGVLALTACLGRLYKDKMEKNESPSLLPLLRTKQLLCIIKSNLCSCFDRLAYFFSIRFCSVRNEKPILKGKEINERDRVRARGVSWPGHNKTVKYGHHNRSGIAEKLKEY